VTDYHGLEAEVNFLPQRSFFGRTTQGRFGVKAGERFRKLGLFAKARPGFLTYGRVHRQTGTFAFNFDGEDLEIDTFSPGRKTYFESDFGGVAEFYPSRRVLARFDVGDTVVWYRGRASRSFSLLPVTLQPDETEHNFQFSAGLAVRF
jgi:hypothetical protein